MTPNIPKPNTPPVRPPQPAVFVAPKLKYFLKEEENKFRPEYLMYLALAVIAVLVFIYGAKSGFDSYLSNWGLRLHRGDVVSTTIDYGSDLSIVTIKVKGSAAARLAALQPDTDTNVYFDYQKLGVAHIPPAGKGRLDSFSMKMGHIDAMRIKLLIDLQPQE